VTFIEPRKLAAVGIVYPLFMNLVTISLHDGSGGRQDFDETALSAAKANSTDGALGSGPEVSVSAHFLDEIPDVGGMFSNKNPFSNVAAVAHSVVIYVKSCLLVYSMQIQKVPYA